MKFQCSECQKTFIYPAKVMDYNLVFKNGVAQSQFTIPSSTIEAHVCPFCKSLNFEDCIEPSPKLVSVVSVDLADVDGKLKEGYEVKELYAKTAVLIKKEKSE